MATSLPSPATVTEIYLAAILAELQAIRKNIRTEPDDSSQSNDGEIDLKEPKQTAKTRPKK